MGPRNWAAEAAAVEMGRRKVGVGGGGVDYRRKRVN